jgi:hypothetical protein
MPIFPALIALGAAGTGLLLVEDRWPLLRGVGGVFLAAAGVFSVVRSAQIYHDNVHFINTTQVAAALWLREYGAANALVATHDIGALGYFSNHPIMDIAGLADPELIPHLNNQPALEMYMRRHHVTYVVIYTNWFPPPNTLVHDLAPNVVYTAPGSPDFVVYDAHW